MLTNVPGLVGVRVDLPKGSSDHSAIFGDYVQEQLKLHLVCKQEVYVKNSVK